MARRGAVPCTAQRIAILALLALSGCMVEGKVVTKKVRLGMPSWKSGAKRENWQFVGKFGFGIGTGEYKIRMRETFPKALSANSQFNLEVFLDEDWPRVEAIANPCDRRALARRNRTIFPAANGEWGAWVPGTMKQNVRPHIWYFVLSDCFVPLTDDMLYKFEVELQARQDGGSEFSIESAWSLPTHALMAVGFTGFLWSFFARTRKFHDHTGTLHPVIWVLIVVVLVQYVAELVHVGHLLVYRSNGKGAVALDLIADMMSILAQATETSLLITIASGYTLTRSRLGDLDIVPLILVFLMFVNIIVSVTDKVSEETANRFTEYEGLKGWLFLTFRIAMSLWFWMASGWTAQAGGTRVQTFIAKFRPAASLYFLSYPVMFFFVQVFAPYWRKPIMESGMMLAQVFSNLWMSRVFLDRGAYFEASSLSMSPLPGSNSPVRFFKDE